MRSVLLRLEGPMQSWGTQGRFAVRDTDTEPSKSGVLGIIGAALGMSRDADERLSQLAQLCMATRVDREGHLMRDYHTVGAGRFRGLAKYRVFGADDTVVTQRHYLADASFLVALGGDAGLIDEIAAALKSPVWPLFLGRRCCPPSVPIFAGVVGGTPEEAVRGAPWTGRGQPPSRLRLVLDAETGRLRDDVPLSFSSRARAYAQRYVRVDWMETPTPAIDVGQV
jgi:CRISPR system Cascade subunit CasD